MSDKHRSLRDKLMRQRAALLVRYRGTVALADEELAERESEDAERAAEQWDAEVLSRLGVAELRELEQTTAALRRLDAGTYGTCQHCERTIDAARLRALPATESCIACALELDRERTLRRSAG